MPPLSRRLVTHSAFSKLNGNFSENQIQTVRRAAGVAGSVRPKCVSSKLEPTTADSHARSVSIP